MRTVAGTRLLPQPTELDTIRALPDILSGGGWYVYFLWDDDDLVYVGSTQVLMSRMDQHRVDKTFNRATGYEYASMQDMMLAEALYLIRYKPKYNKKIPNRHAGKLMPDSIGIATVRNL